MKQTLGYILLEITAAIIILKRRKMKTVRSIHQTPVEQPEHKLKNVPSKDSVPTVTLCPS